MLSTNQNRLGVFDGPGLEGINGFFDTVLSQYPCGARPKSRDVNVRRRLHRRDREFALILRIPCRSRNRHVSNRISVDLSHQNDFEVENRRHNLFVFKKRKDGRIRSYQSSAANRASVRQNLFWCVWKCRDLRRNCHSLHLSRSQWRILALLVR